MSAVSMGEGVRVPDTHAHFEQWGPQEQAARVARATAAGVVPILAVGTDAETSTAAVAAAGRNQDVYAAVGVHPHQASRWGEDQERVREMLEMPRVVAVGEIGLDYYRRGEDPEVQKVVFMTQLRWACEANLPVSIHNRDADEDVLRAIQQTGARAVLHCFSGTLDFAQAALGAGCYLSFAGNVTFPRADALREVAAAVPLDRVLVESDAPVLSPQPWRGRPNEPAYVAATAACLADVRNVPLPALAAQLRDNGQAVFGWGA